THVEVHHHLHGGSRRDDAAADRARADRAQSGTRARAPELRVAARHVGAAERAGHSRPRGRRARPGNVRSGTAPRGVGWADRHRDPALGSLPGAIADPGAHRSEEDGLGPLGGPPEMTRWPSRPPGQAESHRPPKAETMTFHRSQTARWVSLLVCSALVALAIGAPSAVEAQTAQSLLFNGSTASVTFGKAYGLQATSFTVEGWFKRTGTGTFTNTGTGGWGSILPLITKGRGEAETPASLNMNYFLGLRSDGRLAADFEEPSGPNHPIGGNVTTIANGTWYHAAVTYDATTRRYALYLNGAIENDTTLGVGIVPASTSIQHAGLGTAMTSTGVAAGFFQGNIDEPRIWNVARTQAEIQAGMNVEIQAAAGLIGHW